MYSEQGLRRIDPPVVRAGVPLVDGRVVLHARVGARPGGEGDLVPQLAGLHGLARLRRGRHTWPYHLIHRKEAHYQGERVPEETSFYQEIVQDLVHAEAIILIGHGTGTSNAASVLNEYLKTHHREIFPRIIAVETADLSALTEPEIEEIAKKHLRDPAGLPGLSDPRSFS